MQECGFQKDLGWAWQGQGLQCHKACKLLQAWADDTSSWVPFWKLRCVTKITSTVAWAQLVKDVRWESESLLQPSVSGACNEGNCTSNLASPANWGCCGNLQHTRRPIYLPYRWCNFGRLKSWRRQRKHTYKYCINSAKISTSTNVSAGGHKSMTVWWNPY